MLSGLGQNCLTGILLSSLASLAVLNLHAAEKLQFNRDIRPILSDRCFKCHGPDKAARKSGLRLDLADEAYAERKKSRKHPIVPGKPDESLVCQKIFATDKDEMMPPPESNLSLALQEKEKVRRWIAEGARYQPHWPSFHCPTRFPCRPSGTNRGRAATLIASFWHASRRKALNRPAKQTKSAGSAGSITI